MDLPRLLLAFQGTDNSVRRAAEKAYLGAVQRDPQRVIMALVPEMRGNAAEGSRMMAAVLLRKVLERQQKAYRSMAPQHRQQLQAAVLERVTAETAAAARLQAVHCLGQLTAVASHMNPKSVESTLAAEWPSLFSSIFGITQQAEAGRRALGMSLFGLVAEYAGGLPLVPHLRGLVVALHAGLTDSAMPVKVAAVKAIVGVLSAFAKPSNVEAFKSELTPMFQALREVMASDEFLGAEIIDALVSLAKYHPTFFRPQLEPICQGMLAITQNTGFEESTRTSAMEMLVTLAEQAGSMMRRAAAVVSGVIPIAVNLIANIEEDPEWDTRPDFDYNYTMDEDESENELVHSGFSAVDRLSHALGGAAVMPRLMATCGPMLQHRDWRQRAAALHAIGMAGEGAKKHMMRSVATLANGLLKSFEDPHPRVRSAAIRAIAQLAQDYADAPKRVPNFQAQTYKTVIPALVKQLGAANAAHPRVRGMACFALIHFFHREHCKKKHVTGQLQEVLGGLVSVVRECPISPKANAMTAIASLASVVEADLGQYYTRLMPIAKQVLDQAEGMESTNEVVRLRNKSMECVSMICATSSAEQCRADGQGLLRTLGRFVAAPDVDTDTYRYAVRSVVMVAEGLGEEFAPHVPAVVSGLVSTATQEVKMLLVEEGLAGEATVVGVGSSGADGATFTVPVDQESADSAAAAAAAGAQAGAGAQLGNSENMREALQQVLDEHASGAGGASGRRIAIDPNTILRKAAAAHALYELLGLKLRCMIPHVDRIAQALVPVMTDRSSEHVRVSAVCSANLLLEHALLNDADPAHGQRLLPVLVGGLCRVYMGKNEASSAVLTTTAEALAETVRASVESPGRQAVPMLALPAVEALLDCIVHAMRESDERRSDMMEMARENPDFDEEDAQQLQSVLSDEDEMLVSLTDIVTHLLKMHGPAITPAVKAKLQPVIAYFARQEEVPQSRAAAICLLDDIIANGGPAAADLVPLLTPLALKAAGDASPDLRQGAVFGLGVLAEHGGEALAPRVPELAAALQRAITAPDGAEPHLAAATDNAVSALRKLCDFRRSVPGWAPQDMMRLVLSRLPMQADAIEAREVHGWLVTKVGQADSLVVQPAAAKAVVGVLGNIMAAAMQREIDESDESEHLLSAETAALVPQAVRALAGRPGFAGPVGQALAALNPRVRASMQAGQVSPKKK